MIVDSVSYKEEYFDADHFSQQNICILILAFHMLISHSDKLFASEYKIETFE